MSTIGTESPRPSLRLLNRIWGSEIISRRTPGPRRRRRIRDHGLPVHDLTLIDSSDDHAPFVVTRRSATLVEERGPEGDAHEDFSQENIQPVPLLGRRLVLVPQSTGTPRSVQDRCFFRGWSVKETGGGQIPTWRARFRRHSWTVEHNYEVKDLNSSRSERTPQEREGEDQEPRWTRRIRTVC